MNCGIKSGEPRSSERSEILPELLISVCFVLFCLCFQVLLKRSTSDLLELLGLPLFTHNSLLQHRGLSTSRESVYECNETG